MLCGYHSVLYTNIILIYYSAFTCVVPLLPISTYSASGVCELLKYSGNNNSDNSAPAHKPYFKIPSLLSLLRDKSYHSSGKHLSQPN